MFNVIFNDNVNNNYSILPQMNHANRKQPMMPLQAPAMNPCCSSTSSPEDLHFCIKLKELRITWKHPPTIRYIGMYLSAGQSCRYKLPGKVKKLNLVQNYKTYHTCHNA